MIAFAGAPILRLLSTLNAYLGTPWLEPSHSLVPGYLQPGLDILSFGAQLPNGAGDDDLFTTF